MGSGLKKWRKILGYNARQSAERIGVTRPTLSKLGILRSRPFRSRSNWLSRLLIATVGRASESDRLTLVYANTALNGLICWPKLICERFPDNNAALRKVLRPEKPLILFPSPLILDELPLVIWSGPQLMERMRKAAIGQV